MGVSQQFYPETLLSLLKFLSPFEGCHQTQPTDARQKKGGRRWKSRLNSSAANKILRLPQALIEDTKWQQPLRNLEFALFSLTAAAPLS